MDIPSTQKITRFAALLLVGIAVVLALVALLQGRHPAKASEANPAGTAVGAKSVNGASDDGRVVVAGEVDDLTTHGDRRLVVRVEGDRTARWAKQLRGARVSEIDAGAVRLAVDDQTDSDTILDAARTAGRVTEFHFERRRLSEVFREALE